MEDQQNHVSLPDILQDLAERDARDLKRSIAPLEPAKDATIIDTSDMCIDDVLQKIVEIYRRSD